MIKSILVFSSILLCFPVFCQLPNGSPAPDFDVVDINGNSYSLYAMMGSNKAACLDFSATWCSPCWAFHQSGVLESVYNNLGASTTVVFLESDWSTNTACLYGSSGCSGGTQGDWVTGTPYQIADLSSSNGPNVDGAYDIAYYPTLYVISPDKRTWEIVTRTYQNYVNWITKSFTLSATATLTHSSCGDNGKIVMNPTGGFSTLYYKWSNGATTKDLNNLPGGTYSVTISDVNTYFKVYGPYVINGPDKRVDVTNSNLTNIKCYGDATGSISVQVDYGTPPYSYNWSNTNNSYLNDYLKAGNYTLTVTDNNGCTRVKTYTLSQPSALSATAISGKDNCDKIDGFVQVKAMGGVSPYSYNIGEGEQPSPYFSDLKGGRDYTVTITDKNGCQKTVNTYVDVTNKPKVDAGSDKPLDCIKDIINLDGTQSEQGNQFINLWTTANGNIVKGSETLFPDVNKPGKYYLKITDINNKCFDIDSVFVLDKRVFPNITTIGDTTLNCILTTSEAKGNSNHLPTKYYWKKVNDSIFFKNGKNIFVSDSGRYIFHVKDTINLCISKDTVEIKKDQQIPVAVAKVNNDVSCKNTEVLIDGSGSSQGPKFAYQWSTTNGNIVSGANSLVPLVNKGGNYVLAVENLINYCNNNDTAVVYEHTQPLAVFEQSIVALKAQFTDLSQGIPTSWEWTFGDGSKSIQQNPEHIFSTDGEYEVCLTIDNDCGQSVKCQKILVGISSALNLASWDIHNVSCYGGNDGFIKLTIHGGVPPYLYNWSNQESTKDLINISIGDFSVQITDQQGTKLFHSFTIKQPLEIVLSNSTITNASLGKNDGSILLELQGGIPQYNYLWSNGSISNPAVDLPIGEYSCRVKDINGCIKDFGLFKIDEITSSINPTILKRFELSPNPVNGKGLINIQFNQARKYKLTMVNIYGEIVWNVSSKNDHEQISIDLSGYSKGLYFVLLSTDDSQKALKWIVE